MEDLLDPKEDVAVLRLEAVIYKPILDATSTIKKQIKDLKKINQG